MVSVDVTVLVGRRGDCRWLDTHLQGGDKALIKKDLEAGRSATSWIT